MSNSLDAKTSPATSTSLGSISHARIAIDSVTRTSTFRPADSRPRFASCWRSKSIGREVCFGKAERWSRGCRERSRSTSTYSRAEDSRFLTRSSRKAMTSGRRVPS